MPQNRTNEFRVIRASGSPSFDLVSCPPLEMPHLRDVIDYCEIFACDFSLLLNDSLI